MYFDENELPGPIVSTMSDVIDSINKIDQIKDEYRENILLQRRSLLVMKMVFDGASDKLYF